MSDKKQMKGITYCGNCSDYDWKKHKCKICKSIETDARKKFYDDCPLEDVEPVQKWIPVSERLPDVDEYIIISFENFSVPMIGRYTVDDDDSGTFRIGDEDESFVENDLYVIAWMPLPEPYRESEE